VPTGTTTPAVSSAPSSAKKSKFKKWKKSTDGYSLNSGNDILGIVMLEIQGAEDLPKLKNGACRRKRE
jgi:phosphatidylserine decarboxylase